MLERYVLIALLFLVPSQLAYHFWPDWAFVFGIRIDYLAPTVYLTDLFISALVFLRLRVFRKYLVVLVPVLIFGIANTVLSTLPQASLFKWLKIIEFMLFAIYIGNQVVLKYADIVRTTFYSAAFFSVVGIAQFLCSRTLGGPFYFLGERTFTSATPGIALVSFWGREFLRAYSTFSHPNSLAGFLGVVLLLSFFSSRKTKYFLIGSSIIFIGFLLTFSTSGLVGLVAAGILFLVSRKTKIPKKLSLLILPLAVLVSMCLPIIAANIKADFPQKISQRLGLSYAAGKMISERFVFGHGLNTFIVNSSRFENVFPPGHYSSSWLLQPVHNIFLLSISEAGAVGLLVLFLLFYRSMLKSLKGNQLGVFLCLVFIIVTGSSDHYWLTLQQNMILVSLLVGLTFAPIGRKTT